MAQKTHINVKISVESIRDRLRKLLVSEHSALIADVIIGNLDGTDTGLDQLFKSLSGIQDKLKYKIGDIVRADIRGLSTWNWDMKETTDAGLINQGRIRAQIIEINPYRSTPYGIRYDAMEKGVVKSLTNMTMESGICLEEEWPCAEDPDLPF